MPTLGQDLRCLISTEEDGMICLSFYEAGDTPESGDCFPLIFIAPEAATWFGSLIITEGMNSYNNLRASEKEPTG